jgi:hypothetical protein
MTNLEISFHPGPKALAAAAMMAGFSPARFYPAVTDACGVKWPEPTELQIAVALCGGEASGNAWCYHVNSDTSKSVDFGILEINGEAHKAYFTVAAPYKAPLAWNWLNYLDNMKAAYAIYALDGWRPWNAYSGGGYLAQRYDSPVHGPHSWMTWAQHGIIQMQAAAKAYQLLGKTAAQALSLVASVDNDPLELGE